ncbi:hypothetical protein GCM10007973_05460 [Polymorphobacter multimanifer]|uniref:Steroid delta-isomerase-like uncharacterized protein n=1 Tax=Polymorphobacter multimanifer TaxID=1070431 RepID=A0A841LAA1_9SPHN|nr:ester cyclase [Polymorphobacter multimanifer]MBB6226755.1 steroid delta-isomerase-like uncharacterized protein [Polymorphobacter multimanifer]GGI71352.1 hypothetical protein GCM10007973_05460 [Polymorphobacter multimanifer]
MTDIHNLLAAQITAIWSEGRTELIDRLYAEHVIDHMPIAGQASGREGLHLAVGLFRSAMPDLTMHLHGTLACGPIGVDWWTLEGTHTGPLMGDAPTGKRLRFSGIDWVRVADGQIRELWHIEEMFQMQQQLGGGSANFGAPAAAVAIVPAVADAQAAWTPDPETLTDAERKMLSVARRHIEGLWAAGDLRVAAEVYAEDVIDMNPAPGQRPGIPGILDVLGWLREAAPDLEMTIDAYAVQGRFAADRWTMHGTHSGAPLLGHPASGRAFTMQGMDVVRLNDQGRIDRVWHVEDLAALEAQIRT